MKKFKIIPQKFKNTQDFQNGIADFSNLDSQKSITK